MTVIAIDVGGTGIKSALVDRSSFRVRHARWHPTLAERGPDAVLDNLLRVATGLAEQAGVDGLTPRAVGVVVPGIVDESHGIAVSSANLGWRDVPLASVMSERLGLPASVGHDVRAGGLAEARLGAGQGVADLLFVPVGTGIAAAHIHRGHALAGAHRAACELGHIVVRPGGRACRCGRRGCLEAEASARSVAQQYAELTGEQVTAADVADRTATGDPAAVRVWRHTVDALADGLLTAITLFDPERVVLGGGLAQAGDRLLGPLVDAIEARRTFEAAPVVVPASLGDRAGCLGAALLAAGHPPAAIPGNTIGDTHGDVSGDPPTVPAARDPGAAS